MKQIDTYWKEVGREEIWWCSKCSAQINLNTTYKKDRDLQEVLNLYKTHHDIDQLTKDSKSFLCFGVFKKLSSDPFLEKREYTTTWGYAVKHHDDYVRDKKYDELETVTCVARQKVSPYSHYCGTSGPKDIVKIQNKRLIEILKTVKQVEEWDVYNCAEVKCAEKFLTKYPDIAKGTIEFEAIDKNRKRRDPCKNCVQWIYRI